MEPGEALRRAPIFAHLSAGSLKALIRSVKTRAYTPGELLVKEGDEANAFFVLISGEAEAVKGLGREGERVMSDLAATEFFGEMALLDGFPRSVSVRAKTECECAVMSRWDFLGTVRAHPEVALDILPTLSQRLRNCEDMLLP